MNNVLIVAGGTIDRAWFTNHIKNSNYDYIIGVDRGLELIDIMSLTPNLVLGDFDSANDSIREKYINSSDAIVLNNEKDFTDTHMAVMEAIDRGAKAITIVGATGTRLDHVIGNLFLLKLSLDNNVPCTILDTNNRVRLIRGEFSLRKNEQYARYISFLPYTDVVTGVCQEGFKYNLSNATMRRNDTIGVSNEIEKEECCITIEKGILIVIESED